MDSFLKKQGWNSIKKSVKVSIFDIPTELIPALNDDTRLSSETSAEKQVCKTSNENVKGLTCITCGLAFLDYKDQQKHFKSDLHLVNLKRRVKNLGSLTSLPSTHSGDDVVEQSDVQQDAADDDGSSSEESESEQEYEADSSCRPSAYTDDKGRILKQFSAQRGPTFHIHDAQISKWELVLSAGLFGKDSVFQGRDWCLEALQGDAGVTTNATAVSPWSQLSAYVNHLRRNPICGVFLLRSGRFAGAFFDGNTLLIHKVISKVLQSVLSL